MAFDQGLSGLNAASTDLNVIGNNIANASTVGFKGANIQFSDVYASSLGGGGAPTVGIGVSSSNISQQFNQGTISTNSNPLDIAINGNGFFQMSTNGSVSYSRNGQFQLNQNGQIVNSSGANLQGYLANASGILNTGVATNLNINTANLPPIATSTITTGLNLNASAPILTTAGFNAGNPTTYSYSTSVTVYDSQGNSHALQTYYVNTGPSATTTPAGEDVWAVYATVDGTGVPAPVAPSTTPISIGKLAFTNTGTLDAVSTTPVTTPPFSMSLSIPLANGSATPQAVSISVTGTTQYSGVSGVNSQTQNGYASGQLTQFSAGPNGIITGTYSNGQTQTLGQILLVNFVNPNGLHSAGNNQWIASSTSGVPLVGTPGNSNLGALQSDAVENSNTDLTSQLVKMITAQQDYQASAQTIKTESQITQTLVNLR